MTAQERLLPTIVSIAVDISQLRPKTLRSSYNQRSKVLFDSEIELCLLLKPLD